jgi:hypothetical protein
MTRAANVGTQLSKELAMTRKIKGLGLAFVAIAAMSMAVASAVQATELHATDPGPVSIFGEKTAQHQQHVFTTDAGSVKCNVSKFEGTVPASGGQQTTAQELTLTGTYTNCTAFGLAATIDMNGCKYTITNKLGAHTTAQTAYVDITGCTAGKVIEITPTGIPCVVTVPEQHNLSHIVFDNNPEPATTPHDLTATITVTGITYEGHNGCFSLPNTQLTHNGQYIGQATFKATKDPGKEPKIKLHGHEYEPLKQNGAQVGLLAT